MSDGPAPGSGWFNRTVIGAGLTSFLADVGYELATSLLAPFLGLLRLSKEQAGLALGAIEATAEFVSNAAKLLVGWYSDRIGRRKEFVVGGYALTGVSFAFAAVAAGWPLVLLAKSLAWLGKGIRGPLRNAIISDAVDLAHRGKAFGFHRAGDTLGAVLGPLLGWAIVNSLPAEWFPDDPAGAYRAAFWLTLLPGLGAALTFALLVREKRFTPKPGLRLGASVRSLPRGYGRFLVGVGLFGLGDFALPLLQLAATASLAPELGAQQAAEAGLLLYAGRNLVMAAAAVPAGWLADRVGHVRVLVGGYVVGAATMAWTGLALALSNLTGDSGPDVFGWAVFFGLAGVYMAVQEALEPAIVPALVPDRAVQGTAYGVLAAVNGLADVAASLTVGGLFAVAGVAAGFAYASVMMVLGGAWMAYLANPERQRRG
jgi:MFS family permease